MKRIIATCASLLIATSLFAQDEGGATPRSYSDQTGVLAALSDLRWTEYMTKFAKSTLGTYERCGGYLFTYTPKGKEKERRAPMVGFAYPNDKGDIGSTVLRSADRIHVHETEAVPRAESTHTEDGKEHLNVYLTKDEIGKVRSCGKVAVTKNK